MTAGLPNQSGPPQFSTCLLRTGEFRPHAQLAPAVIQPLRVSSLRDALDPQSPYLPPFRPMGAGSSATSCTSSTAGTVIDLSGFDQIRNIDAYGDTATVQPGVRIGDLAVELAKHGLELAGGHDLMSRTVGGAIAGACAGPAFGEDGAFFASQVKSLRIITPVGKPVEIRAEQPNLLNAFRQSYGMFGVIYDITLKVRPIRPFTATHRRCTFVQFARACEKLGKLDVGLKFYLLPFRDRVYLDIRRNAPGATSGYRMPWKIKDWGESTVLPYVFKSLNRIVPMPGIRFRLIDGISRVTQELVNNRLVNSGSNSSAQLCSTRDNDATKELYYSTWFFPAGDFAIVVQAYRDFCQRIRASSNYRCDMPTVGFRVGRDRSALLSPSFDEPMVALRAISTQARGWEDFVIDFSDFARHWGGIPAFNQTRAIPAGYPAQVFGRRLTFFNQLRKRFDPANRMLNPFLSQYFL